VNLHTQEYQQLFKMFDTDGSGAIGSEELKGAMQSIGLEADDAEIERLIKEVNGMGGN
jgi:calmodulin